MANEIQITHDDAAETVYAIIRNQSGQWYVAATPETFESSHWSTYAIALSVVDSSSPPATGNIAIQGTFPAVAAGFYWLDTYVRAGATAAQTDYRLERRLVYWNGTTLVPAGGAADARQVNASAPAAANVASVFLGTGHTDDVDLTARNLHILSDTDHAVRFESTRDGKDGQHNVGVAIGMSNTGSVGLYNTGAAYGQYNYGPAIGQWNNSPLIGQKNTGGGVGADIYCAGTGTIINASGNVVQIAAAAAMAAYNTTGVAKEASVGAIQTILTGITSLASWLRGLYRKDAINPTALAEINAVHDGGSAGTFSATTDSNEAIADKTSGLTAQETRDAMKLAPTAGDPAAGSIDAELDAAATAAGVTAATSPLATAAALAVVDGIVDAIKVKTDQIGTAQVTYSSWVTDGGIQRIFAGEDFLAADGRALSVTITDYAGPSLAGATAKMRILSNASYNELAADVGAADLEVTATISVDGTTVVVSADLTAAQTAAFSTSPPMPPVNYVYQFIATLSTTHKVMLTYGRMTVAKTIGAGA